MRRLSFCPEGLQRILCIGAHCDDIEIGCGATLLRLLQENPGVQITWVVLSSTARRRREALHAAKLFLKDMKQHTIHVKSFRDSYFPHQGGQIKDFINTLKAAPSPDLIFTHYRNDLHQDHRFASELTWNTFRDHIICEYEIPKYDGDLGHPNLFVEMAERLLNEKIEYILQSFKSQASKPWFTRDTFEALARLRGVEAASKTKFAEGFHCRKMLL